MHLKEIFLSDPAYPWTVQEMAKKINVSVSHLNRLFRTEFNQSPTQYLQELRLKQAAELLENSFLSIKEIRHATGFCSKNIFIKCFKKKYHLPPKEYRKHLDEQADKRQIFEEK